MYKIDELFISDDLPNVLTNEEIYELLGKFKNGDQNARNKVIEHNIKLVLFIVNNKFNYSFDDSKELVSVGNIGLIKAVDTFDISKKVNFSTYAGKCIYNEIGNFLRNNNKYLAINGTNKTYFNDDDLNLNFEELICDDSEIDNDYIDFETYLFIQKLVNSLPDRERKIITMRFGFYNDIVYNQYEIAKYFNLSQSYVSRLINKALDKIKIQLEENNFIERQEKRLIKRRR